MIDADTHVVEKRDRMTGRVLGPSAATDKQARKYGENFKATKLHD